MVITNSKLVFLDNPKCGSSTMREHYYNQLKGVKYRGNSRITGVNMNYSDHRYVHTNIKGAVNYIKNILKENPKDYTFITTIRNPYKRFISAYNHDKTKYGFKGSLSDYVKEGSHFSKFNSKDFRFFDDYKTSELVKCEDLHEDMSKLNKKYNLGLNINSKAKANVGKRKSKIVFNDFIVSRIHELFAEDFTDGGYEKLSVEELNKLYG